MEPDELIVNIDDDENINHDTSIPVTAKNQKSYLIASHFVPLDDDYYIVEVKEEKEEKEKDILSLDNLVLNAAEKSVKNNFPLPKKNLFEEELISYHSAGLTLKYIRIDNASILSIPLYEKKFSLQTIPLVPNYSLGSGCIGIYRHAYPHSKTVNFGYLEETRVIIKVALFGEYLQFTLAPVVMISDEINDQGKPFQLIHYINNVVNLILVDEDPPYHWVKMELQDNSKTNMGQLREGNNTRLTMRFKKGCSFDLCLYPKNRTFVYNGSYVEKNGYNSSESANGIIPAYFVRLYQEAVDKSSIPGLI